jgi:hypothetical protein
LIDIDMSCVQSWPLCSGKFLLLRPC